MPATTSNEGWEPTEARTIRARSETNRIITFTPSTLEESGIAVGLDMAIYARKGEIRLYPWSEPIPEAVAESDFRPCGVREVHTSGTSTVITLTETALGVAGVTKGDRMQQWSGAESLRLTTEGPNPEVPA